MTGGWKQKSGWIQIFPASGIPFTFPFLSQPSVCLLVSRVRAYLTTDQQTTNSIILHILYIFIMRELTMVDLSVYPNHRLGTCITTLIIVLIT